jgi:hypothetical protein
MNLEARIKLNTEFDNIVSKVNNSNLSDYEQRRIKRILNMKKKIIEREINKERISQSEISSIFKKAIETNNLSTHLYT